MHSTQHRAIRTRLLQPLAASALIVAGLFLPPTASAQMNQPQASPPAQSPQTPSAQPPSAQRPSPQAPSPSPTISDQKLNAAAVAIGQVTSITQSYKRKIAEAPPSDTQRITQEENTALEKAVTDQGLSVDEYNTIIRTAQNDPAVRQKLSERIPHSGQ
jgi:Domain of unknown function (DUF4168)